MLERSAIAPTRAQAAKVQTITAPDGRSNKADSATVEDLWRFQLHLVDEGASPITLRATITGLRFFFDVTLGRGELMAKM